MYKLNCIITVKEIEVENKILEQKIMKGRFFMSEEATKKHKKNVVVKKAVSLETFVFLAIFFSIFGLMARKMGNRLCLKQ